MAVVINEFEVMPQTSPQNNQETAKKADEKSGGQKGEMSELDVKKMLERRAERMERIAAH